MTIGGSGVFNRAGGTLSGASGSTINLANAPAGAMTSRLIPSR